MGVAVLLAITLSIRDSVLAVELLEVDQLVGQTEPHRVMGPLALLQVSLPAARG